MSLSSFLLAHTAVLGLVATPRTTPYVGDALALMTSNTDDVASADQRFGVSIHLKQTGSGTSRALVVTSHDGVKWCVAAAGTLLDRDGAEVYEIIEPTRLLRFVAVVTVLTGDPAHSHILAASLLSNGRFQLTKATKTVNLALAVVDATVETASKNGRATLSTGQSQVDVVFQKPWQNASYTIVASPEGEPVACWVTNRTALGFRLRVTAPVGQDTPVHWMAVHD